MLLNDAISIVRNHLTAHDNIFIVNVDDPFTDVRMVGDWLISAACDDRDINYDTYDYIWYSISHLEYEDTGDHNIKFYVTYYDTQAEEEQAISALAGIAASLNITNLSIPDAIRAFYNWIADNVTYDTATKTITQYTKTGESQVSVALNSLYDVVVTKHAVCQGIANTMYYFINKYIGPCRVIQGNEVGSTFRLYYHCWNICMINNVWYWIDATAACERHATDPTTQELWLLKNAYDFTHISNAAKYIPLPGYMRNEWLNKYGNNMTETSWTF